MNNNNCVSYLEALTPRFKKQMDEAIANGERPKPRIKTLWMEFQKRARNIQNAC